MDPQITVELLEKLWRAIRFGEHKIAGNVVDRIALTDPQQPGLRIRINHEGISFWVRFTAGTPPIEATHGAPQSSVAIAPDDGATPDDWLKIGEFPATTVERARRLAAAVRLLAGEGIDVKEALAKYLP